MNEQRAINFTAAEFRFTDDDNSVLEGYASVFNSKTDLGRFDEVIEPGAFTRALAEGQDVRALIDHDSGRIIGRTKNGTLELREDAKGLHSRITLPDTQDGRDLSVLIERGDLDAMSFGFMVKGDRWEKQEGRNTRHITDVDLMDVSVVAFPAYPDATVALRSMPDDEQGDNRRLRFDLLLKSFRRNSWQ